MSDWLNHVKATLKLLRAKNPNASLKDALKAASKTYHKGSVSKSRKGDLDFTTKSGDVDFHPMGKNVRRKRRPFSKKLKRKSKSRSKRRYRKGSPSRTHKGRKDFTTKKGSKVYHRKGHYVRKSRKPYTKRRN
jgi:hypothetical protein